MLIIPPPKFRKNRVRSKNEDATPTPPPVVGPVLVSASFNWNKEFVQLGFDRPIDVSGIDVTKIQVNDGEYNNALLMGSGSAELYDPNTVEIDLDPIGDPTGSGVLLTVVTGNGIVAANDGQPWAGVSGLVLPFG